MAANLHVVIYGLHSLNGGQNKKKQAGFFVFDKFTLQNLADKSGDV